MESKIAKTQQDVKMQAIRKETPGSQFMAGFMALPKAVGGIL
jgi:hypothetical protein